MDKKIIDLQVKELSKEQYTKEHVLNELAHVLDYVPTTSKKKQRLQKMDKTFRRLYIAYCEMLELEGRDVICYTKKSQPKHLLRKLGETNYTFYPERLNHYFNEVKPKPIRQKIKDKYESWTAQADLDNLSEYEKGYLDCLKQMMFKCGLMDGHDVYVKEVENVDIS